MTFEEAFTKTNKHDNNNKKRITIRLISACIVQLSYPVLLFTGKIFGYNFNINAIITSLLTILLISPLMVGNVSDESKIQRLTKTILPLFIVSNGLLFWFEQNIQTSYYLISVFFIVLCFCYSLYKLIRIKNKKISQTISIILSTVLFITFIFSAFLYTLFNELGGKTTVKSVLSPDNKYIAEVTDVDQGALGGDTVVYVSKTTNDFSVIIGKFTPSKELIYIGEWGESDDMQIKWKDNNTLLINSEEYDLTSNL